MAELVARKVIANPKDATLDELRVAYIRHLREIAAGRASEEGLDLATERAKLARAQTENTELKNAQLRGELLLRDDVLKHWAHLVLTVKEKLRALPAHARARIPGVTKKVAKVLAELVDEALSELADDGVPGARRDPDEAGS